MRNSRSRFWRKTKEQSGEIDQNSRFRNLHPKWSNLDPIALVNFSNENKIEANQEQRCRLNNKIVKKLTQGKLL